MNPVISATFRQIRLRCEDLDPTDVPCLPVPVLTASEISRLEWGHPCPHLDFAISIYGEDGAQRCLLSLRLNKHKRMPICHSYQRLRRPKSRTKRRLKYTYEFVSRSRNLPKPLLAKILTRIRDSKPTRMTYHGLEPNSPGWVHVHPQPMFITAFSATGLRLSPSTPLKTLHSSPVEKHESSTSQHLP